MSSGSGAWSSPSRARPRLEGAALRLAALRSFARAWRSSTRLDRRAARSSAARRLSRTYRRAGPPLPTWRSPPWWRASWPASRWRCAGAARRPPARPPSSASRPRRVEPRSPRSPPYGAPRRTAQPSGLGPLFERGTQQRGPSVEPLVVEQRPAGVEHPSLDGRDGPDGRDRRHSVLPTTCSAMVIGSRTTVTARSTALAGALIGHPPEGSARPVAGQRLRPRGVRPRPRGWRRRASATDRSRIAPASAAAADGWPPPHGRRPGLPPWPPAARPRRPAAAPRPRGVQLGGLGRFDGQSALFDVDGRPPLLDLRGFPLRFGAVGSLGRRPRPRPCSVQLTLMLEVVAAERLAGRLLGLTCQLIEESHGHGRYPRALRKRPRAKSTPMAWLQRRAVSGIRAGTGGRRDPCGWPGAWRPP